MKTLITIFLFLINNVGAFSQTVTWQRYYDHNNRGDEGYDVEQTFDGGYIFAGETTLGGSRKEILLIKVNFLGVIEWKKIIGDTNKFVIERAKSIKQSTDSGFIIAGEGDNSLLLLKTDKFGNVQWRRDFTQQGGQARGWSLKLTRKGIIACGDIFFFSSGTYPYIVKTDLSGKLEWQIFYSDLLNVIAHDIIVSEDSSYYFCAINIIRKISNDGKVLWTKSLSNHLGFLSLRSLLFQSSSEIYAGGGSDSMGIQAMHLAKLDSSGRVLWEKRFLPPNSFAESICASSNKDIIMIGNIWLQSSDVAFAKISASGNLLVSNIINSFGLSDDVANSIRSAKDEGFIIAGATPFGGTELYRNVLGIKTDSNGYAPKVVGIVENLVISRDFVLYQNFPNPFNSNTIIKYELRKSSFVSLNIFDIGGKKISNLVSENKNAGIHSIMFNANNFPTGIYFYILDSHQFEKNSIEDVNLQTRRMIILK